MFLSSKASVLIVLDRLQINQAKRKNAEQDDQNNANQYATAAAVWIHLVVEGLATG
jgi:zinc transporter ZupT